MPLPSPSRFTVLPGTVSLPISAGGKARAMARLTAAGFPVPHWFLVLPDAFTSSATARDPAWRGRMDDWESLRRWVANLPLHPQAQLEVDRLLAEPLKPHITYAVRSSGADEDSPTRSFAGQLDSYLFVPPRDIPRRIASVWASAFNEHLRAYRSERKLDILPIAPGIIVQEMIDAEVAGVAFSADPVSGRRSVAIVSGVWGLGSGLISGEDDADTWQIGRDGAVLDRHVVPKTVAHRHAPGSPEGIAATPVPFTHQHQPCLTDEQVKAVAALARKVESYFGRPQDIEWAWADGRIHLLRARTITTLAGLADPEGRWTLWDNSDIAESYNGITTPLTFSFAHRAYAAVYEGFCRLLAVPPARLEANRLVFSRMIGLVRGRVYYNLLSWHRILALLPGYQVNRRFVEKSMGVKEPLPPQASAALAPRPRVLTRLLDALILGRSIAGLAWALLTLGRRLKRFNRRLRRALAPPPVPLDRQRLDELAAHYHELERELLLRWDAPLVNDLFAMIFFGILRNRCRRWLGDETGTLANDLISGESGVVSMEPARRVRTLAVLARQNAALTEAFCTGSLGEIRRRLDSDPRLKTACEDYLEQFGERCLEELKLETTTLFDDPLPLYRAIGHAARRSTASEVFDETRLRRAAEARVSQTLARHRLRRFVFAPILHQARQRVKYRENLRFERTRVLGRVRRIVVEMARRLVTEGQLDDARDVFYLTLDELLGFVDGTTVATDLRGLAALRRLEFDRWRKAPPPADRFETTGAVHIGNCFETPPNRIQPSASGDSIQGLGCCPGVVRGRTRVILHPHDAELRSGEILVAHRTDPGWILLFPAAAGLLVEHGSLLSHSAIVAREMALPAVVSLPGLTGWLNDGDWVEMDGGSGVVRKITPPAPRSA